MSFENFSLPNMTTSQEHDAEFEFCSVTKPGESPNTPADHLFFNGRLMPHAFPCSPTRPYNSPSRSMSCTRTSFGSKDGFESSYSGSDSCSSSRRSSSCSSSARTSVSDVASERRMLIRARRPRTASKCAPERYQANKQLSAQYYGSRKLQFIATTPVLNSKASHRTGKVSHRKKVEARDQQVTKAKKRGSAKTRNGCWPRFLCWFMSACNEYHAIKPSRREH